MANDLQLPAKTDEAMSFVERVRDGALLDPQQWPDDRIMAVKQMYGNAAKNAAQLVAFLHISNKYQLAPDLQEIWLVDMGERQGVKPVTGRDAIMKVARRDPKYGGHESGVVRKGDKFIATRDGTGNVAINHVITGFDRGAIDGAYSVCKYEGRPDVLILRAWDDYAHLQKKDNWVRYGETMILTRAVTEAHRLVCNISGLYVESEFAEDEEQAASAETARATRGRIEELKETMGVEAEEAEFEKEEETSAPQEQPEKETSQGEQEVPEATEEPGESEGFQTNPLTEPQKRKVFKDWRSLCDILGFDDKKLQEDLFEKRFGQRIQDLTATRAATVIDSIKDEETSHRDWLMDGSWK